MKACICVDVFGPPFLKVNKFRTPRGDCVCLQQATLLDVACCWVNEGLKTTSGN